MSDWIDRMPPPPPVSPTARPALGVALAFNVLIAAGVHMGMSFAVSIQASEELWATLMQAAPIVYLTLMLPVVGAYGIAAAAWTGWSWWRVPFATLAGATMALGLNAWLMAQWMAHQGWKVGPLMSVSDGRVWNMLILAGASCLVLLLMTLTMFKRWERAST